jgi:hypothetical protein
VAVVLAAASASRQLLSVSIARCLSREDGVHDFGAGGEDGAEFAAVDDFGGACAGVPGEPGDFLDGNAGGGGDEGVSQLARGPALSDVRGLADGAELALDVGGVQGDAGPGGEDEILLVPLVADLSAAAACWSLRARSATAAIRGRARVRRDLAVLVSPWARTERHTATLAGKGGLAYGRRD